MLIAAARGIGPLGIRAFELICDITQREFASSDLVRYETLPKPSYFGRKAELQFYEAFFTSVSTWAPIDKSTMEAAFEEACLSGLSWADAAHVILAERHGCDELITSEKPSSAIHRTNRIRVVSIDY